MGVGYHGNLDDAETRYSLVVVVAEIGLHALEIDQIVVVGSYEGQMGTAD